MPKPRVQSSSHLVGSDVTICTIRFVVVSPKNESQNAKIFHVWPSWRAELGVSLVWCHKRLLNRFLVSGNTSISKQSNASWRSSGGFFFRELLRWRRSAGGPDDERRSDYKGHSSAALTIKTQRVASKEITLLIPPGSIGLSILHTNIQSSISPIRIGRHKGYSEVKDQLRNNK